MTRTNSIAHRSRTGVALLGCAFISGAATLPVQAALYEPAPPAQSDQAPPAHASVIVVETPSGPGTIDTAFVERVERTLVSIGYPQDVAEAIAPMITEKDLATLAEHPEMLRVGGDIDDNDVETVYFVVGILLIVVLLLAII